MRTKTFTQNNEELILKSGDDFLFEDENIFGKNYLSDEEIEYIEDEGFSLDQPYKIGTTGE